MRRLLLTMLILSFAGIAQAQSRPFSAEYQANLRKAAISRRAEVAASNRSQAEALRVVTRGLNMVTRPAYAYNPGFPNFQNFGGYNNYRNNFGGYNNYRNNFGGYNNYRNNFGGYNNYRNNFGFVQTQSPSFIKQRRWQ